MKLVRLDDGRQGIVFEGKEESQRYEAAAAQVRRLMPMLVRLWVTEPRFVKKLEDYVALTRVPGQTVDFHVSDEAWLAGMQQLVLVKAEEQARRGRPLEDRTIVAAMRLMMFAPYDLVLGLEKQWQEKHNMSEVRDRNVRRAVEKAHRDAVRDANMCVARAQSVVDKARAEFMEEHPGDYIRFVIVSDEASKVDVQALLAAQAAGADAGTKQP